MRKSLLFILLLPALNAWSQVLQTDLQTGALNGSITLGAVTSGDLSVPITLNYYTNGVKVKDSPSNAGMGWTVVAGGSITRELRGLPDDFVTTGALGDARNGWMNGSTSVDQFTPSADMNYLNCSDEVSDYNAINAMAINIDTEPDIFSFSAPGLSGSFAFDKNNIPQPLPYQDIKIEYIRDTYNHWIKQIDITNNQGVKYTFKGVKRAHRTSGKGVNIPTVDRFYSRMAMHQGSEYYYTDFGLSQITSPTGSSISLTYATTVVSSSSVEPYREVNTLGKISTIFTISDDFIENRLQYIDGQNQRATITWNGDQIGAITIKEKSYNQERKFNFLYSNVMTAGLIILDPGFFIRVPFLSSLTEETSCQRFPGYNFEYHGITGKVSPVYFYSDTLQDKFGYFNQSGTSVVPDLYTKTGDTGTNGERYRFESAPGYTLTASGGSRAVNSSVVMYHTLKKVTTPSGAITEIEYEPATYFDATAGATLNGAGVRVKNIWTSGGDLQSRVRTHYNYNNSSGQSTGRWLYRPMFAMAYGATAVRFAQNMAPDETILYSEVDVSVTGAGRTHYEFQNPGVYPETNNGDFNASYTRLARLSTGCTTDNAKMAGSYTFPYAPNTNYDFERRLPATITQYTLDNKIVQKRLLTYQRTTKPIASIACIRYEKVLDFYAYTKYFLYANVGKNVLTEITRTYDQSDVANSRYVETTSTYSYNSNQLLRQVALVNSDNSTLAQTYKYANDYASTGTDTQSTMINGLVSANRHGTLIEETTKNGSVYTSGSLTLFDNTFGGSRILPKQRLKLGDNASFVESTVTGPAFVASTNYYPTTYFDAYDNYGTSTIRRDQTKQKASLILGHNSSLPLVEITGARADEVVYADFEPNPSSAPTYTGALNTTDVWSGRNSLSLNTGTSVTKTSIARGSGRYYKFSTWIKAAATATLNVSINSGTAVPVNYTSAGAWQYVEKIIDMNSITAAFSFTLTSTSNVIVDNIVFAPEASSFIAHAYEPLYGKTADLDSRGNAMFQEYDALGRLYRIRDREKNITKIYDYHYMRQTVAPTAQILGKSDPRMDSTVVYSIDLGCITGATYQWYMDGTLVGSSPTLSYTFPQNRTYNLKVTVVSNYGNVDAELIVKPRPYITVTSSKTGPQNISCFDGTRTVTLTLSGCYDTSNLKFDWTVTGGTSLNVQTTGAAGASRTFDLSNATSSVQISCIVTTQCIDGTTGIAEPVILNVNAGGYFRAPFISGCDN